MDQTAYLALLVPARLGRQEAERLVRETLAKRGEQPWEAMELELFPGSGGGLLIARRCWRQRSYISLTALSVLLEHRG
ncbi:MAG: hypothetical protein IJE26_06840 [Oscillospiraceae bacterium]|nr:hypothetical protein [Oscillospiraceae bacterium]